jgi:ribosome biogenesis GTPase
MVNYNTDQENQYNDNGLVIASYSNHHLVQKKVGARSTKLKCVTRGRRNDIAVGDSVQLNVLSPNQGVIEAFEERKSVLYRSRHGKPRLVAANMTQLFVIVGAEPVFSSNFISRALLAAEAAFIKPHIVLNKIDITNSLERSRKKLQIYSDLGYPIYEISVRSFPDKASEILMPLIVGQSTILIGQSGMGKSSLVNLIMPKARAAVRETSTFLNAGKHTTTSTQLHQINEDDTSFNGLPANIIDSPGFREFGLYRLTERVLERSFREFIPYLGRCRFYNCRHLTEPDCAVLEAIKNNRVSLTRYKLYVQLMHE